MLLYTFKAKVTTCKIIKYVRETLSKVIISTPIKIHKWFNKPRIRHTKKHYKTSNDFVQANNLVITNGTVNQEDTVVDTHT